MTTSYPCSRILLAVLALILIFPGLSPVLGAKKGPKEVPVGVARAVVKSFTTKIALPGTVVPWAITQLSAEIDGRVLKIHFREGQRVKKGDLLVQMRTLPLELQRELARAEEKLVAARLEELLSGTRDESIEAAKFSAQQAKTRVELTKGELKRTAKLSADGVVSTGKYDKARADAAEAQAELEEKQAVLKELVAGPRVEKINQERANLEAAKARTRIIQDNIAQASIRAPFNGSIVKKETEVGQWLEKGDPAVSMIDDSSLKVEVNLPQHNFSAVEIGASAKIFLESHQSTSSYKTFTGRVIEKIPSGNPTSRTFPVRIKIDKPDRSIAAGMLVNVEIYAKKPGQELIFVPKDAVVRTPKDSSVWVVRPDKNKKYVAHKVMVTTGKLEDNLIAISFKKSRIKHGDLVVVQGNERLKPNAIVKIIKRFN